MKHLLLVAGLLIGLATNCSKKEAPAPDFFLGHWVAESVRRISYDAAGKITTDQTDHLPVQLDITMTTMTFTGPPTVGPSLIETGPYTRNGESLALTLVLSPPGTTYYVRNLTSDAFILEYDGPRLAGQAYYVQTVPYHR